MFVRRNTSKFVCDVSQKLISYAAYDLEPAAHESQHGMRPLMLRKHF